MGKLVQAIKFVNLMDRKGSLSVANLAVYSILLKVILTEFSLVAVAALAVTLAVHSFKGFLADRAERLESDRLAAAEVKTTSTDKVDIDNLKLQSEDNKEALSSLSKENKTLGDNLKALETKLAKLSLKVNPIQ